MDVIKFAEDLGHSFSNDVIPRLEEYAIELHNIYCDVIDIEYGSKNQRYKTALGLSDIEKCCYKIFKPFFIFLSPCLGHDDKKPYGFDLKPNVFGSDGMLVYFTFYHRKGKIIGCVALGCGSKAIEFSVFNNDSSRPSHCHLSFESDDFTKMFNKEFSIRYVE